jgi:hypothetical protein
MFKDILQSFIFGAILGKGMFFDCSKGITWKDAKTKPSCFPFLSERGIHSLNILYQKKKKFVEKKIQIIKIK